MDSNKFFNAEEMADLLNQIDNSQLEKTELDEEMKASQRRYEEIIKKHQQQK